MEALGSSTSSLDTVTVTAARPAAKSDFWAGSSFSFHDLLDAINPLQHIPIVGTIYRAITGDTIGNAARVVGDTLYGGPLGLAAGIADVAAIETTGKDIGQNLIAMVEGGDTQAAAGAIGAGPARPAGAAAPASWNQPATAVAATQPAATAAMATPAPAAPKPTPQIAGAATATPQQQLARVPLPPTSKFIPIDTSANGIMAMRAQSAVHSPAPIPFNPPPGTMPPTSVSAMDFSEKMRQGLDKYAALMAQQNSAQTAGGAVDQVH